MGFWGFGGSTSYGTPALKVGKKLVLRMHQKEDAIVVMLNSVEEQQALIQADPMGFYITDHYAGYPAVLVRPTIKLGQLKQMIEASWHRVANKTQREQFAQLKSAH